MNMLATIIVAAAVGGILGAGAGHIAGTAAVKRAAVKTTGTDSLKARQRTVWAALDQSEVDAITAGLKEIPDGMRRPIQIVCGDRGECGELALDLENAFESAKWTVNVVAPVFADDLRGRVLVSDPVVAGVLSKATSLSIVTKPTPISGPAEMLPSVTVFIGRP